MATITGISGNHRVESVATLPWNRWQPSSGICSYGYGYGLGGLGGVDPWQYDEGTLLIHFIDMEKNELIWRGSGTKILADHPSIEDKIKNINAAVAEILNQFPP